ncbi:MAG: exodeoxyribonuclease VII small subunit [Eubacterium sp.]
MDKEMTYEKAMSRLEEIVSLLENGEISLDDSMKLFEEGTNLTALCSKKLNEAEQKITLLSKE